MPRLLSHLQGNSSDYKTKPSLRVNSVSSYSFDEPFAASMARRGGLPHPWHLEELTVFLSVLLDIWDSSEATAPPKCLSASELSHKAAL